MRPHSPITVSTAGLDMKSQNQILFLGPRDGLLNTSLKLLEQTWFGMSKLFGSMLRRYGGFNTHRPHTHTH